MELYIEIGNVKKIRKPKPWKHPQPITKTQLIQLREEFWDTAPHYGGRKGNFNSKFLLSLVILLVNISASEGYVAWSGFTRKTCYNNPKNFYVCWRSYDKQEVSLKEKQLKDAIKSQGLSISEIIACKEKCCIVDQLPKKMIFF